MDIYDCRSEYDFYNRFAETIMKSMSNKLEQVVENIKQFLVRVSPKISFSPDPTSEYSLSLGITPKDYSPEEILNLPERIAQERESAWWSASTNSSKLENSLILLRFRKTAWRLAASSECIILFLWKQEASDGKHFPKPTHAFLYVWRDAALGLHSY